MLQAEVYRWRVHTTSRPLDNTSTLKQYDHQSSVSFATNLVIIARDGVIVIEFDGTEVFEAKLDKFGVIEEVFMGDSCFCL